MEDSKNETILYKYRSWKDCNHRNLLEKNQLYLSSPKDFNDVFDCRISTNYYLLDSAYKIEKFIDLKIKTHREYFIRNHLNIDNEREILRKRLTDNLDQFQKDFEAGIYKTQDKHYGILSLSKTWKNILMWSHYADYHRGFCIGLYESKLRKSNLFGTGGSVQYDKFPTISPFDMDLMKNSFVETHYKAKDWKYEEEYRMTKLLYPNIPSPKDRIITIADDFFAEIILGFNIPDTDMAEIITIARLKKIKVYQVKKVPFQFEFDRVEIIK